MILAWLFGHNSSTLETGEEAADEREEEIRRAGERTARENDACGSGCSHECCTGFEVR